jgi:ribosome-associated protein
LKRKTTPDERYDDRPDEGSGNRSDESKPSRTQKKKAAEALQEIGTQLISLSQAQLDELELPPEMVEAVADARKMNSHGARRRQLQYIGSLMRQIDATQLKQDLDRLTSHSHQEARSFKLAEQWRDELISGKQDRLAWLVAQFPVDKELLVRLIEDAGKSQMERRKAGRALFRYLRRIAEDFRSASVD